MAEMMTWRELAASIENMEEDLKDDLACVWLPKDVNWAFIGEFIGFTELAPFDAEEVPGDDNPYSLNTGL